jgi:hypothetical protein
MIAVSDLTGLALHMEWADSAAVLESEQARTDERLRQWLHHVHTVQQAFTAMWRGRVPELLDASATGAGRLGPDRPPAAAGVLIGLAALGSFRRWLRGYHDIGLTHLHERILEVRVRKFLASALSRTGVGL